MFSLFSVFVLLSRAWAGTDGRGVIGSRCAVSWNKLHKSEEPVPYWNWEPTHCSLDAVDADKFCLAMKGRKGVLLVGEDVI